jgi:hypothetical protein
MPEGAISFLKAYSWNSPCLPSHQMLGETLGSATGPGGGGTTVCHLLEDVVLAIREGLMRQLDSGAMSRYRCWMLPWAWPSGRIVRHSDTSSSASSPESIRILPPPRLFLEAHEGKYVGPGSLESTSFYGMSFLVLEAALKPCVGLLIIYGRMLGKMSRLSSSV